MPKIIADPTNKIINASFDVLKKYGEEKFSMRLVAKKANISVGTIYNYYPDKEALLKVIDEKQGEILIKEISSFKAKGRELKECLEELYDKVYRVLDLEQPKESILPGLTKGLGRLGKEGLEQDYLALLATVLIEGIKDNRSKGVILQLLLKGLK